MAAESQQGRGVRILPPCAIALAGALAYHNSLHSPFILDDYPYILESTSICRLWPLGPLLAGTTRPLVNLTLALNYAAGGLEVFGYHLVNVLIHLGAAFLLYGLTRRALLSPSLVARHGRSAPWIAMAAALLWVVHPLQTESVSYTIQRAESLMGLWYLLMLYSLARGWHAAAIVSCALGMATKPVMVTAPLAALLYDRTFLAGSFREAWRRRRGLYAWLAATWLLLIACLLQAPNEYQTSVGFTVQRMTPLAYLLTQPGVILHYLRLALWPQPLILDYGWPVASSVGAIVPPALGVAALIVLTVMAWRVSPPLGCLGILFFLILAPTSSVLPIKDACFEHRMYLPLAAVLLLGVLGMDAVLRRLPSGSARRLLAAGLLLPLAAWWLVLTIHRNEAYASDVVLWEQTVAARPLNPRAHAGLARALANQGRLEEALAHSKRELALNPQSRDAYNNMGTVLGRQGRLEGARAAFEQTLRLQPDYPVAHKNLGMVLAKLGRLEEAIAHYQEAIRRHPRYANAYYELGNALDQQGKLEEAIANFGKAAELNPRFAQAYNNLGAALIRQRKLHDAEAAFERALRLNPRDAEAHNNLATALTLDGRLDDAIAHYEEALRLEPGHAGIRENLEKVRAARATLP